MVYFVIYLLSDIFATGLPLLLYKSGGRGARQRAAIRCKPVKTRQNASWEAKPLPTHCLKHKNLSQLITENIITSFHSTSWFCKLGVQTYSRSTVDHLQKVNLSINMKSEESSEKSWSSPSLPLHLLCCGFYVEAMERKWTRNTKVGQRQSVDTALSSLPPFPALTKVVET